MCSRPFAFTFAILFRKQKTPPRPACGLQGRKVRFNLTRYHPGAAIPHGDRPRQVLPTPPCFSGVVSYPGAVTGATVHKGTFPIAPTHREHDVGRFTTSVPQRRSANSSGAIFNGASDTGFHQTRLAPVGGRPPTPPRHRLSTVSIVSDFSRRPPRCQQAVPSWAFSQADGR